MPPLKDMLKVQDLKGFEAVDNPKTPPPAMMQGKGLGINPYLRCPLPPFSATPDTLRQFNESGATPARRVIPLPISTQVGTGTTINKATVISNGSGGSSGSGSSKLVAATAVLNTPLLAPNGVYQATIQLQSRSFQLLQINSSGPIEVRLYANPSTQASDVVRQPDTAVPFEIVSNIITDVLFDTAPFNWSWQNRIGANADNPQSNNLYVSVINPSSTMSAAGVTITIIYLPLES